MRTRTWLVPLATLAVGAAIWALTRRAEDGAPASTPPARAVEEPRAPALAEGKADDAAPSPAPEAPSVAPSKALEGRVRVGGFPSAGLRVRAVPSEGMPSPWTETGRDGRFRIEGLADRPHRVVVKLGPFVDEFVAAADAVPGSTPLDVDLPETSWPFAPRPGDADTKAVRIRIVGHDGAPVAKARVAILFGGGFGGFAAVVDGTFARSPREAWNWEYEISAPTDERGQTLPYGPLRVRAPESTEDVTVRLPPERVVEGRLLDATDQPISGATLQAVSTSSPVLESSARTDAAGRFRFANLGPDAYDVRPEEPPMPPVVVSGDWTLRPDARHVELRYRVGATVSIRVVDRAATPVAGALVSVSLPGRSVLRSSRSPPPLSGKTDETGVARLSPVDPEGDMVLSVTPLGRADLQSHVRKPWRPTDETVVLEPGLSIAGVVRDERGTPVRGVVLRKGDDGAFAPFAASKTDGTFARGSLPPGPVTLAAAASFGKPTGPEVTADTGATDVVLVVGPSR